MKNKISVLDFLPSVISLFCAIGLMTFCRACDLKPDGSWMRCHAAQMMAFAVSLCLTLIMLCPAFIKNKLARSIFYVLGLAGGILLFLVPGIIKPLCMMQTMRCYTHMQPYVRVLSIVEIIFCLILFIKANLKKMPDDE